MAYNPTEWKDRVVDNPRTYTVQNNPDGTITLVPAPGTVHEAGTPVNAVNMNHIEQGIAEAHYFAVTSGTSSAYTITLDPAPASYAEIEGLSIRVAVHTDSAAAGVTLNVNGLGAIPLKKANGNDAKFKANGVYTFVYYDGNFILQGEGGSGNAQPEDVLEGKTFSNDDGDQVGTMPDRRGANISGTPFTLPESPNTLRLNPTLSGYIDNTTSVYVTDNDWVESNIKVGVNVFGKVGTFTSDANAIASYILEGYSAYVNGVKVNGTMPNKGTGGYATDAISISGNQLRFSIPETGRYDANGYIYHIDNNWVENNIVEGVSIFGKVGTRRPWDGESPFATGDMTRIDSSTFRVSDLSFEPNIVVLRFSRGSGASNTFSCGRWRLDATGSGDYLINGNGSTKSISWSFWSTGFSVTGSFETGSTMHFWAYDLG